MTQAPTSLTHWAAFRWTSNPATSLPWHRSTATPTHHRCWGNLPGSIRHSSRIATPAVRRGWLRDGSGPSTQRGADEFVAVSWDELTELLAGELRRVVDTYGNEAIYGGSYG